MTQVSSLDATVIFVLLVAGILGVTGIVMHVRERLGWDDRRPLPWETPGARNDRAHLLEDEVR